MSGVIGQLGLVIIVSMSSGNHAANVNIGIGDG